MTHDEYTALLASVEGHTPGPWHVTPSGAGVADKKFWFDADGSRHGETPNMLITHDVPSDVRLIAAAPALLEEVGRLRAALTKAAFEFSGICTAVPRSFDRELHEMAARGAKIVSDALHGVAP